MSHEEELLVHEGDAVRTLVINRPDQRNLLTPGCLLKIRDVMYRLSRDERVRAVVLRGAGDRAFSAGYDIAALPTQNRR